MFLSDTDFREVIKYTPLVSIDFIVTNKKGEVLLGLRKNRPAKDFWFVPGGRIFKNETINEAFGRISENEFGERMDLAKASFLGIYEHFYNDNIIKDDTFGTHYIVLGYALPAELSILNCPTEQHKEYRWFSMETLFSSSDVHDNTKAYF